MIDRWIEVIRRSDGAFVPAELKRMSALELLDAEMSWRPAREEIREELLRGNVSKEEWPQSLHWNWSRKAGELRLLEASAFAILQDRRWQGVMLTKTGSHFGRLAENRAKPIVYVDFLESAPWNWNVTPIARKGEFKGIGVNLLLEAIRQSIREGFHGRVGLHSLGQARTFYQRTCGMTMIGHDPTKHNLAYYEFEAEQARDFLTEGGLR